MSHITYQLPTDTNDQYRPEAFIDSPDSRAELAPTRTWLINRYVDGLEGSITRMIAQKHSLASHAAAQAAERAERVADEQRAFAAMVSNHEHQQFMEQPTQVSAGERATTNTTADNPAIAVARDRVSQALEGSPQGLRPVDQDNLGATSEQFTTAA